MLYDSTFEQLPDTLGMHIKCPDVTLATYRRINKIELAHNVMKKYRVYLDTKYWIRFRDLLLGRNKDPHDAKLYELLKNAAGEERLICPVSYSALSELLTQQDEHTRLTTARLMDQLSGNVCLEPPHLLMANEVDYFVGQAMLNDPDAYLPADLAWTRPAFYVGQATLQADALSTEQCLAMQKTIDDALASLTIEQFIGQLGGSPRIQSGERQDYLKTVTQETTDTLNTEKVKTENLHKTFDDYVLSEVIGISDCQKSIFAPVMERAMVKSGYQNDINDADSALGAEMLKRFLVAAFRAGKLREQIPQLLIGASLHALVRYEQKRGYKVGDCEDFRHAGSALPYCHVFLTERTLTHMLTHPPASLDKLFDCAVFANSADALPHIEQNVSS